MHRTLAGSPPGLNEEAILTLVPIPDFLKTRRFALRMKEGGLKGITKGQSCSHELSSSYVINFLNRKNAKCVPVGFGCKSYTMFKSGQCFDCGADGSKCAPATYESMEYFKNFANSDERMFFDTSTDKTNYCRKRRIL